MNRELRAIDITTARGAHTVLVISARAHPRGGTGTQRLATHATDLSVREALRSATTENVQRLPERTGADVSGDAEPDRGEIAYWEGLKGRGADWLQGTEPRSRARRTRREVGHQPGQRLRKAIRAARNAGARRIVAVDLTRGQATLKCVQVLTPGLRSSLLEKGPGRYDTVQSWFRTGEKARSEEELPEWGPTG